MTASLRDWFAGTALAGILSKKDDGPWDANRDAINAYGIADAMIAEKRKRES